MTAHTPESISAQLADWSIFVTGKSTDGDAESEEDEPAVIRESDE